jgi:hypothetical protein
LKRWQHIDGREPPGKIFRGIWGYADFLEAIGDPEHPEHDNMMEWAGEEFDPEHFDPQEVNARLTRMKR